MATLRMPAEHADLIVECLVYRWQNRFEEHRDSDADALLSLAGRLQAEVPLIRGLRDQREATDPERVREIAKEHMDIMQHEVGREHSCLLRLQAGDRDYFVPGQTQAEAEKSTRDEIERYSREALLAREVFEAIRDGKDEVVSVGGVAA